MLSDSDYQTIKVSTLLAGETSSRVVSSPSTVYYDEEMYSRVYESMTMLRHHLCVVFSELDLFRAMFRTQIAGALGEMINEPPDAAAPVVNAPSRNDDSGGLPVVGGDDARSANGVEEPGAVAKPKAKRPYRRRNQGAVPVPAEVVGASDGGGEVGGTPEA